MLTVLIVEDDPMVAEINRGYLQRTEGFCLAGMVPNGAEALAFLQGAQVSLLLLDVFMPGMDGFALLREIREKHPLTDVIMVTAARRSVDIQTALRLGVMDCLVKPFTFERFQAALVAYRERMRLLGTDDELSQDMLDKGIFTKRAHSRTLPKGIDAATLKLVRDAAAGYGAEFSVNGNETDAGIEVWTANASGAPTMKGTASW